MKDFSISDFGIGLWVIGTAILLVVAFAGCGDDGGGVGEPDAAPPALDGEACELAEECASGACVTDILEGEILFPNGMCLDDCSADRFGCDEGANCVPVTTACSADDPNLPDCVSYCTILCESDIDCRVDEDYGCLKLSPWELYRYCLPESLRRPWDDGTADTAG